MFLQFIFHVYLCVCRTLIQIMNARFDFYLPFQIILDILDNIARIYEETLLSKVIQFELTYYNLYYVVFTYENIQFNEATHRVELDRSQRTLYLICYCVACVLVALRHTLPLLWWKEVFVQLLLDR